MLKMVVSDGCHSGVSISSGQLRALIRRRGGGAQDGRRRIGGSGMDIRSKARTLAKEVKDPKKLPKWNHDGSSTGQAPGQDSEVILYRQAIFRDPFRRGKNILVMCDAYTPAGEPIPTNKRHNAAKIFSHPDVVAEEPWYGIEQEYTLLKKEVKWPLEWPSGGYPGPQVNANLRASPMALCPL